MWSLTITKRGQPRRQAWKNHKNSMRAESGIGRSSANGLCSPFACPWISGIAYRRGSTSGLSFNFTYSAGNPHLVGVRLRGGRCGAAIEPRHDGFKQRLDAFAHELERHGRGALDAEFD